MAAKREILLEGWTEDEILRLPAEELRGLILTGEPVVFQIGSATILGEILVDDGQLRLELAQIEGGGEGALLTLGALARRYSQLNGISEIAWVVHAVHCAHPNLKLRRVLERRGFCVDSAAGVEAYRKIERVNAP